MDPAAGERQIRKLRAMKAGRDQAAVDAALARLRAGAESTDNIMPCLIDAVKTYATLGEICGVLRDVFGEYVPDRVSL